MAIKRKEDILAQYYPKHVSDEIDDRIRSEFPIFLSKKLSVGNYSFGYY
jgi:hypothetical protein